MQRQQKTADVDGTVFKRLKIICGHRYWISFLKLIVITFINWTENTWEDVSIFKLLNRLKYDWACIISLKAKFT